MTPAELSRTVLRSVRGAVEERELSVPVPARIVVQPPPRPGCGDYASNVALQLAKPAGRPAREVAEILRKRLAGTPGIDRVEIAGPGFLNFTLGDGALVTLVRDVLAQGPAYGDRSAGNRPVADLVSADPAPVGRVSTGRASAGRPGPGARAAVVGEVLERIGAAAGWAGRADGHPALVPVPDDLATLTARLGTDEARWILLRPAAHDPVRVPERPVQRESNPRFRVQYAHARTRALVRNAADLGFLSEPGGVGAPAAAGSGAEFRPAPASAHALHTLLAGHPSVVEAAARLRAPDRLVRHLEATADAFFRWHDDCPPLPVGEQKPLAVHRARLALAEATGTVLANGLRLLGISAPEHL
ncbi:ArgS-related anticodon-binding protein NrtL [Streptomyces lydicus]|uniref:ArgS-related anticodon-binding protein NrtL n=1 Tax=Streptomyces lydicus TaxID=47763 RepID=UPI000980C26C|nr:DALR anticodon-binding domain-containing protein [Streptomyces lydicus]